MDVSSYSVLAEIFYNWLLRAEGGSDTPEVGLVSLDAVREVLDKQRLLVTRSYWISLSRQIVGTLGGGYPPGHLGTYSSICGEGNQTLVPGRLSGGRGSLTGGNCVLICPVRSKGEHGML